MNYKRLIDDLKHYATQYASGATLGRMIVETDDLMFEAAEVIESLTKADSWTLVEDELPPNEEEVLLYVETAYRDSNDLYHDIVKGFYTDGEHRANDSNHNWSYWQYDENSNDIPGNPKIKRGWWENIYCYDVVDEIPGKVIAWMPLPEMQSIKEMRQK